MKKLKTKEEKEKNLLSKEKKKIKNKKYITKGQLNKKMKSSQSFINTSFVDNGIIYLKDNKVANVFSVQAIDLSLSSVEQKTSFFSQLKYLYQIKDLDLRIYKLDESINLNSNKDYIKEMLEKYKNNESNYLFLQERLSLLEKLESDDFNAYSNYYFVVVAQNENFLKKNVDELERICYNLSPRLNIEKLINKYEIYKFLINLYCSESSLEQLLWCDLVELISPLHVYEKSNCLKIDNEEIQLLSIKCVPPFLDELFFEQIFNMPNSRCCIHIKDTIDTDNLINVLDSSYQFLLSDRVTTQKLSDATELDTQKENFQLLMDSIKNGDEKIKEINFIIVVSGEKKKREETIRELIRIADYYKIKLDITRLRQYETWQAYDISSNSIFDYSIFLPTLTLAAGFPLSQTSFNDKSGIMMGLDTHTALPVFFDLFQLSTSRTSHNLSIVGSTGSGKSYILKKIIVNELNQNNVKCFIFDCEKEYKKLTERNKGEYIDLYSKSGGIINPLQIRFLPADDDNDNDINNCPLPKHLGFLESFYKCAFEEISEKELVVLLQETETLYADFGITKNSTISMIENMKPNEFPIFSDLKKHIEKDKAKTKDKEKLKIIEQLDILLERFLVGTDSFLFNDYTNLDLDKSNLICFNLQELLFSENKRLINTQILNILTYLNNVIVKNKIVNEKNNNDKSHIMVVVDEFHLFIDENNPEILRNFGQMARRLRKYSSSFVCATQSIKDFVGSANILRHATAIFNNCQYNLTGILKEDDMQAYIELFKQNPLTDTQQQFLMQAKQGEFLLNITSKQRIRLWIRATELERYLMGEE